MNKTINLIAFNLIGKTAESGLDDISGLDLQPALYAGFTDLNKLRHDFPVVLGNYDDAGSFARSLSAIVNDILKKNAPQGSEGEFMRCQILNIEQEIRENIAGSAGLSLMEAWVTATHNLRSRIDNNLLKAFDKCLEHIWGALKFDGQIIDCNAALPIAMLRQAWAIDQRKKAYASRKRVDELILRLEHILGAEIKKSKETLSPNSLKGSVGSSFENAFDFEVMSRVLTPANPRDRLPEGRRQRILDTLKVLQSQRFFKSAKWSQKKSRRAGPFSFLFKSAASALRAIESRISDMVELIRVISIAELEIANRYEPAKHDAFFAKFDESSLLPEDLAFFPTYLIWLDGGPKGAKDKARILKLLSSGMPVKILAQNEDILDSLTGSKKRLPFGDKSWQLANMAISLNDVFVLQSSSANLYKVRDKLWDGLTYYGPALFCVFSSGDLNGPGLPSYLVSAAATESRAFPTLSYDPSKGPDWASRLSISYNPQLDKDWPVHSFSYEDEDLQRLSEDIVFTFIEFVASDKRFSNFFARVPRREWSEAMVPAGQYLEANSDEQGKTIPYVLMVDENHILHRLVVDDRLIRAARRCREMWHSLQEMGGVHNSHARNLLELERELWQAEKDSEIAKLRTTALADSTTKISDQKAAPSEPETPDEPEQAQSVSTDDPVIETPRCTTCNECTDINPQMFSYNDNMQAFLADLSAGTYRQLVEAAENCQVSIIHPGKPRDMSEPNLDELMERAALFH